MLPMIGGQRSTATGLSWAASVAPTTPLPVLGLFGMGSHSQPLPFFNQENLAFPVTAALWGNGWTFPPPPQVQTQSAVGRPILGRRTEPNFQTPLSAGNVVNSNKQQLHSGPMDNGEDIDRGVKRSRTPSPLDNWTKNNNQVSTLNRNTLHKSVPAPVTSYPVLGVNMSIPPPPIVNLPRSRESERYFHPISQQACTPVELHVTNLDQSIDLREMKKLLMAAFREHVMVLHVSVFVQSDGTLAASVKVQSMQDAQYAISQLHRRKVGFKRIMIAHAHSSTPQNPQHIKNQIISLLLEIPGHKMPLFTFRELFASRYLTTVSVSDLYRMRDVCIIMDENNGRTISLNPEYRNTPSPARESDLPFCVRHSQQIGVGDKGWAEQEQPNLPNVRVSLTRLSERVTSLVQSHDNWLPLASLMDCYAAEFEPLPVSEHGAPLEHLVACISGIELLHSGSNKHMQLCPHRPPMDNKSDESLLLCVSPSLAHQVNLFARELVDLLKMQPHCQLLFNKFIPAYHHHFGRQCRVADYGFTKLIDLLETLPHVIQVMGEGNKRVVTLSHRAQVRRFTSDLLRVLKSQTNRQLLVSELPGLFERVLNRPFDPVDYGLCYLEDLLSELSPNIVNVSGEGNDLNIALPKREQTPEEIERTKQFAGQVIELLSHTPQFSMEFAKFIPAYHHHFGSQCRVADFGFTKLIELFEAIPDILKVEDEVEGSRKVTLTLPEKLKVLNNQMLELVLPRYPPGLNLENVQSAYLWQFGYALKPTIYGCNKLSDLLGQLSSIQIMSDGDGTSVISPVDQSPARVLKLRVLRVLWEQPYCRMSLDEFNLTFHQYYQQTCERQILETDLQAVAKITEDTIQLTPLQVFARDVYHVLSGSSGRLPLTAFDMVYHRMFRTDLVPSRFGCHSTLALLQSVDNVVSLSGRGPKRTLVLNCELASAGISLPPGFVKSEGNVEKEFNIHSDVSAHRACSQSLLRGIHLKMNEERARQEKSWDSLWDGKPSPNNKTNHNTSDQETTVVNLPEPRTPPSKEECMALLSPAKFLLPAHAFPFHPSSPHPSELPKPGHFNLTQVNLETDEELNQAENLDANEQAKRKLRLAAHFPSTINM